MSGTSNTPNRLAEIAALVGAGATAATVAHAASRDQVIECPNSSFARKHAGGRHRHGCRARRGNRGGNAPPGAEMVIEEMVRGRELGVDAVVSGGTTRLVLVRDKLLTALP